MGKRHTKHAVEVLGMRMTTYPERLAENTAATQETVVAP